jgi:hypothetical protein
MTEQRPATRPGDEAHEGSCCCGRIRYRLRGPFGSFSHCHCTDCRKTHGAAFATYLGVERARFELVRGGEGLSGHTTETGTRRNFCRDCGSSLTCTVAAEPDTVYVAAGTLDTPLRLAPEYHIFVRSKVPWLDLNDGLPQHREYSGS